MVPECGHKIIIQGTQFPRNRETNTVSEFNEIEVTAMKELYKSTETQSFPVTYASLFLGRCSAAIALSKNGAGIPNDTDGLTSSSFCINLIFSS